MRRGWLTGVALCGSVLFIGTPGSQAATIDFEDAFGTVGVSQIVPASSPQTIDGVTFGVSVSGAAEPGSLGLDNFGQSAAPAFGFTSDALQFRAQFSQPVPAAATVDFTMTFAGPVGAIAFLGATTPSQFGTYDLLADGTPVATFSFTTLSGAPAAYSFDLSAYAPTVVAIRSTAASIAGPGDVFLFSIDDLTWTEATSQAPEPTAALLVLAGAAAAWRRARPAVTG